MNKKKIGLFGGTFNPPHIGHLLIAKNVKKEFNLNKIIFIPAYIPPHKQNQTQQIIDSKHRFNMLELLIENEIDFIISDFELKKADISYSIDTVKYFKNELPDHELFFLLGSDNFYYIDTWKDYKELLNIINFIIYLRDGFTKEKIIEKYKSIIGKNVFWSKSELYEISSSEIRKKIKNGENCVRDVGEKVWKYIVKNNLYK